jgi:hypothetical protein
VEALRRKYAPRLARLEERIRRAGSTVEREQEQATGQKLQTAISLGATLLSAFLGRRALGQGTLGRATTAARGVGRAAKESGDVDRAREDLGSLQSQREELARDLENEVAELTARLDSLAEPLETTALRPRRGDVEVRLVALAWAPCTRASDGSVTALWQ